MSILKSSPPFQDFQQKHKTKKQFTYPSILPNCQLSLSPSNLETPMPLNHSHQTNSTNSRDTSPAPLATDPRLTYLSPNSNLLPPSGNNFLKMTVQPVNRDESNLGKNQQHSRLGDTHPIKEVKNEQISNNYFSPRVNHKNNCFGENFNQYMSIKYERDLKKSPAKQVNPSLEFSYPENISPEFWQYTSSKNSYYYQYRNMSERPNQKGVEGDGIIRINEHKEHCQNERQKILRQHKQYENNNAKRKYQGAKVRKIMYSIKEMKEHFQYDEWSRLISSLEIMLENRAEGGKLLWNLIDSYKGARRVKMGQKIFEILSLLECQEIFDILKKEEQIQRSSEKARISSIKKLLGKLSTKI